MYVYIDETSSDESGRVCLVGFYKPDGRFYIESMFTDRENGNAKGAAADRVHFLNGGN